MQIWSKEREKRLRKKNEERTEEEKSKFFYKVVGIQVKKWHLKREAAM